MSQNKIHLIQNKMDELSTSLNRLIKEVSEKKAALIPYHEIISEQTQEIIPEYIQSFNEIRTVVDNTLASYKDDLRIAENRTEIQVSHIEEAVDNIVDFPTIQNNDETEYSIADYAKLSEDVEAQVFAEVPDSLESVRSLDELGHSTKDSIQSDDVVEHEVFEVKSASETIELQEAEYSIAHMKETSEDVPAEQFVVLSSVNDEVEELIPASMISGVSQYSEPTDFDLSMDLDFDDVPEAVIETVSDAPVDKIDDQYIDGFFEEWEDLSANISEGIEQIKEGDESFIAGLHRDLHTLKGHVSFLGAIRIRTKVHAMETTIQDVVNEIKYISEIIDDIAEQFEQVKEMVMSIENGTYESFSIESPESKPLENIEVVSPVYGDTESEEEFSAEQWVAFKEQYEDVAEEIDGLLNNLMSGDKNAIIELSRSLHGLKGSVGMTGASKARKAVHEMETILEKLRFEAVELEGKLDVSVAKNIMKRFDFFKAMIEEIDQGNIESYENIGLAKRNKALSETSAAVEIIENQDNKASDSVVVPFIKKNKDDAFVKVDVHTLNVLSNEMNEVKLGNASNETSVNQSLIHIKEFEEIVNIMTKKLRELELETDSQIQSKSLLVEEAKVAGVDHAMDSLELDRYQDIHEIVKSFSESVNDTFDIYQALKRVTEEMQAILMAQKRAIEETQNNLSKARLIPFSSKSDSSQLLVTKVAKELGKKARLMTRNDSIEVDRSVLHKIGPALDHALRNCLTHGIEMPEVRKSKGKREEGTIEINVKQEGGRLYITIEDDGAGVNVEKVREKAIEKGLWDAKNPMSDRQAVDMICLPSFSTAEVVNHHAGRGVGLDVVRNDILSMGGKYEITSQFGKGMKVEIQLPTSISTVSALMVSTGNEMLGIPVEVIIDVRQLSKEEVIEANSTGRISLVIEGTRREIDFRYLSDLIGLHHDPKTMATYKHLIVCEDREGAMAVLVGELIGVNELPIKPLGRTLSSVPGVVSATLLPNGSAAFIIDPARARTTLLRHHGLDSDEAKLPVKNVVDISNTVIAKKMIMVVDDSITLRKAAGRLLQKEGFDYVTATDGQHAIEMLATVSPDAIILDVEMPRKDGFAFAQYVREHQRFKDVPIIMVTSRIAEKHQKRARALGVNEYISKPFKDDELIHYIREHLDK